MVVMSLCRSKLYSKHFTFSRYPKWEEVRVRIDVRPPEGMDEAYITDDDDMFVVKTEQCSSRRVFQRSSQAYTGAPSTDVLEISDESSEGEERIHGMALDSTEESEVEVNDIEVRKNIPSSTNDLSENQGCCSKSLDDGNSNENSFDIVVEDHVPLTRTSTPEKIAVSEKSKESEKAVFLDMMKGYSVKR